MKKSLLLALSIYTCCTILIGCVAFRLSRGIQDYEFWFTHDSDSPCNGSIKVTFLGVTTLLVDDGETQILVDCYFSRHPLWKVATGKLKTNQKKVEDAVSKFGIDRLGAIFVSHSHFDHAIDVAYVAQKTGAMLHGSPSTLNIGRGGGLSEEQIIPFDAEKEVTIGAFTIIAIPSKHSPLRVLGNNIGKTIDQPLCQPERATKYVEGETYDFLIKHRENSIYIITSANFIEGMRDKYRADVVFLSIGYIARHGFEFIDPYWENSVEMLKPSLIIPIHWENFFTPLTNNMQLFSPIIDKTEKSFDFVIEKCIEENIDLKILQGGSSIVLFEK